MFPPEPNYGTELDDHRLVRKILASHYGRRQVLGLRERATEIIDGYLAKMISSGQPADLRSAVIMPFAIRVMFEFAGIPEQDWLLLADWLAAVRRNPDLPAGTGRTPVDAAREYMTKMLSRKLADPGPGVISGIAADIGRRAAGEPDVLIAAIGKVGLVDFDVIGERICYGLLYLLAGDGLLDRLNADKTLIQTATEEIMRLAVPGGSWIPRYALADIELAHAHIRTSDLVVFAMQAANRDASEFPDPERFDISRNPNSHVGFGHGKFYCLGAHLSRLMLHVALERIAGRLPGLRLAIPPADIQLARTKVTGGLRHLPVAWE